MCRLTAGLATTADVTRPDEFSNLRSPGVKPGWDEITCLSLLVFKPWLIRLKAGRGQVANFNSTTIPETFLLVQLRENH
jgi:hypothetical protein